MQYYLVAPAVMAHKSSGAFTYHSSSELVPGNIVMVQVGKKDVHGIVLKRVSKPTGFMTKPVLKIILEKPVPEWLVQTAIWLNGYYATHMSTVLQTILPRGLIKKRRDQQISVDIPIRKRTNIVLNRHQANAFALLAKTHNGTALLRGVTGSGKTQVYIELAKKKFEAGKSVIVLVPEIALTSQLVADFAKDFKNLVVTHSTMTEAQRHLVWRQCMESTGPIVVVGPRSALFSPVPNLGLIIIDECHEPSYKQDQSPRYSALRVASMIGQFSDSLVVLGSATPSILDSYVAIQNDRPVAVLPEPARKFKKADIQVVPLTNRDLFTKHRFLSNRLLHNIEEALTDGKQALIFHNRRGSAPVTICENCGWTADCPRCFLPLTLHTDEHKLRCHVCNFSGSVPPACPVCSEPNIIHKGLGTKLVVSELENLFPSARIMRFDADSAAHEQLHKNYQDLYDGKINLIVGTQMIAKGLDLPHLKAVGVIQADSGLTLPDYQSEERVFQLIYQVCGRVGRSEEDTNIVVQTYQPDHPSIKLGVAQDYDSFYEYALTQRKIGHFPPYSYLLKLTCVYATEQGAIRASKKLAAELQRQFGDKVYLLGPAPAFYERMYDTYRWQIIVRAKSRALLLEIAAAVPTQHWQVDLDPASLL